MLRYVLTANAPENKDNDFTWNDFQTRNNNELVAIFGNFINRVMVLTHKYFDGVVPEQNDPNDIDKNTLKTLRQYPEKIGRSITKYRFREALQELMNLARLGNKYLADEEPWKVIKTDEERVKTIMFTALQIAAGLAVLSEPFLPFTSTKLKKMLRLREGENAPSWNNVADNKVLLPSGQHIEKPELLFSKIEDSDIQTQLDKLKAGKEAKETDDANVDPQKDECTFEDFTKIDIRTGTILEAEKMPKADKLLVLKIDTGIDVRTIVSGIAENFDPKAIIGKQVSVIVNLAPRKLRGVLSQGMILMAETPDGKLVFVNPDEEGVDNGAVIR